MSETKDCSATHASVGQCEAIEGHEGMHRHGEYTGRVMFWSCPHDLATRAEIVAELELLQKISVDVNPMLYVVGGPVTVDQQFGERAYDRQRVILHTLVDASGSGARKGSVP